VSGYTIGPSLAPDQPPWPLQWESDPRIDDGHAHDWECVLLEGNHDLHDVIHAAAHQANGTWGTVADYIAARLREALH
jgi:hypothetical protein